MDSYSFCHYLENIVLHQIEVKLKNKQITNQRAKEIAAAFLEFISEEYTIPELHKNVNDFLHYAPELEKEINQAVESYK